MITEFGEERQRRLVLDYFGGGSQLRLLRRTPTFGSPVFVVDFDRGVRHFRTLGSFGSSIQVTEQSSMDLLYPARLVFHYERLMSLSFAMGRQAVTALLLGVGGAAMWRFMRAYLPDCAPTLVDADEAIVSIARRWFYLTQPVTVEPAQEFVAVTTARFDVILVDLYNSAGPSESNGLFWTRCLDALAPGGVLAINWADFSVNPGGPADGRRARRGSPRRAVSHRSTSPGAAFATTSCSTSRPSPALTPKPSPTCMPASCCSTARPIAAAAFSKTAS